MSKQSSQDLEFKTLEVEGWRSFKPEMAIRDGVKFIRKTGSNVVYREVETGYKCINCTGNIISADVAHPIWDGPFNGAGSGRCYNETVPYCPKCEAKPGFSGSPIRVERMFPLTGREAGHLAAKLDYDFYDKIVKFS